MDDICDSVDTAEQAQRLTSDLDKVLEKGGFNVKGWISNEDLLNEESHSREEVRMKILQGEAEEKILGVTWNSNTDTFTFKVKPTPSSLPSCCPNI